MFKLRKLATRNPRIVLTVRYRILPELDLGDLGSV